MTTTQQDLRQALLPKYADGRESKKLQPNGSFPLHLGPINYEPWRKAIITSHNPKKSYAQYAKFQELVKDCGQQKVAAATAERHLDERKRHLDEAQIEFDEAARKARALQITFQECTSEIARHQASLQASLPT